MSVFVAAELYTLMPGTNFRNAFQSNYFEIT